MRADGCACVRLRELFASRKLIRRGPVPAWWFHLRRTSLWVAKLRRVSTAIGEQIIVLCRLCHRTQLCLSHGAVSWWQLRLEVWSLLLYRWFSWDVVSKQPLRLQAAGMGGRHAILPGLCTLYSAEHTGAS
eukprot:2839686-Pyramimonas_sp.AAC.1